jgi:hypothetical protein
MPRKLKKHPKDMTNDELAEHVFHPKILKHAKEHIAKLNSPRKPSKPSK